MLAPLRQHLRRDSHPERLALLELLNALEEDLGACEGSVKIYVSQWEAKKERKWM